MPSGAFSAKAKNPLALKTPEDFFLQGVYYVSSSLAIDFHKSIPTTLMNKAYTLERALSQEV